MPEVAGDVLRALTMAVPYKIHTVMLTDNGTHFTTPGNVYPAAEIRIAMDTGEHFRAHSFEHVCAQNHIDHRPTRPRHP